MKSIEEMIANFESIKVAVDIELLAEKDEIIE